MLPLPVEELLMLGVTVFPTPIIKSEDLPPLVVVELTEVAVGSTASTVVSEAPELENAIPQSLPLKRLF